MLRLRCPGCTKALSVPESLAGKMGVCPHCKSKVRVPQLDSPESDVDVLDELPEVPAPASKGRRSRQEDEVEEVEWEEVSPPSRSRRDDDERITERRRPRDDDREERISERRRPRDEEDEDDYDRPRRRRQDDDYDDEPPRRRPRRRRRPRSSSSTSGGMSGFMIMLIVLGGLCLVSTVLTLIWPLAGLGTMLMGGLITLVGGIMFLVVAFQDDVMQGILCWFVPFYSLYYLITHWDEEKGPFIIQMAGVFIYLVGMFATGAGLAMRLR
jgi:hypothetical protein